MKRLSQITEAINFMKVSKSLEDYAKKYGGVDKEDFQKVAAYVREIGKNSSTMVQNKAFTAMKKFIDDMDSDPRDGVLQILKKGGMFKNGRLMQESVEQITEFSDAQLAQLKKAYQNLEKINVASPTYKKLKKMIASMDAKMLEKVARAKVKFVSQIAARELAAKGVKLKAKDYMEAAVSQQQQKLMGLALAYKRGEVSANDISPEAKAMADKMSEKDLEDFAKTKHKGLPVTKEETGEKEECPKCKGKGCDHCDNKGYHVNESVKTTHVVIDTANGNKVVAAASSEQGAKSSVASAERPPMNIKDKKTLKIVKLKKPVGDKQTSRMVGFPLTEGRKIDPADVDDVATDDDRKAADKNVVMQIRKAADLEKGSDIEFPSGKKGKLSQADAKKLSNMFNTLKRPADKEKFQKVVSKDLQSIKALLKRLGR